MASLGAASAAAVGLGNLTSGLLGVDRGKVMEGHCWPQGEDPRNQWNPFVDPGDCTVGQLVFTVCIYGYALFEASNLISDGSELLLLIPQWAPLVGSVVLPVLGAVPDGMMVLVSGMGGNPQKEVTVGVGALAGSTIMLLTLPFFLAMIAGRVNVKPDGSMMYKRPPNADEDWEKLSPPGNMSLTGTGISVLPSLNDAARFMLVTCTGYFVIQVPSFLVDGQMSALEGGADEAAQQAAQVSEARDENIWALMGLIFCTGFFFFYLYRMWADAQGDEGEVHDMIHQAEVTALKEGHLTLRGVLSQFSDSKWLGVQSELTEALVSKDALDEVRRMCKVLAPFFALYDVNGDNSIDFEEFRMIFKDVNENLPKEAQRHMFETADTDGSGSICFEEFVACFMMFIKETPPEQIKAQLSKKPRKSIRSADAYLRQEDDDSQSKASGRDGEDDDDDEGEGEEEEDIPEDLADLEPEEQRRRIKLRAFTKMTFGSALVLIFSDPTVGVLAEIGERSNISPFYISFVLAPLASNATELVAAYNYARKKTVKTMTTSLSSLLGAGVMNNTFCLGIFLGLIYFKRLAWEFTAETITIVVVEVAVGILCLAKQNMDLFWGYAVLSLYPLSLALVWFLENKVGID